MKWLIGRNDFPTNRTDEIIVRVTEIRPSSWYLIVGVFTFSKWWMNRGFCNKRSIRFKDTLKYFCFDLFLILQKWKRIYYYFSFFFFCTLRIEFFEIESWIVNNKLYNNRYWYLILTQNDFARKYMQLKFIVRIIYGNFGHQEWYFRSKWKSLKVK